MRIHIPSPEGTQLAVSEHIANVSETLELGGILDYFQLPAALENAQNLRNVSIRHCAVEIPAWLCRIKTIETLEIESVLSVSNLLPHIHELENLKRLKLDCVDDIDEFPDGIGRLRLLEELSINGWGISDLPDGLASLKKLRAFDFHLYHNNLGRVFDIVSQMRNLKSLHFNFCDLDNPSERFNGYSLPASFLDCGSLEEIHFDEWPHLNGLPGGIDRLKSLKVVNVGYRHFIDEGFGSNYIKELPESIGNLEHLEELNLFGCLNIKKLPESFKNVTTLKSLNANNSGIAELRLTDRH